MAKTKTKLKKGITSRVIFKLGAVYTFAALSLYAYHGYEDFMMFSHFSENFKASTCGEQMSEWTCYNMKWQVNMGNRKTNYLGSWIGHTIGINFIDNWSKKQNTKDPVVNLQILNHYGEMYNETLSSINNYKAAQYSEAYLPFSLAEELARDMVIKKVKPMILTDMQAKSRFLMPQLKPEGGRDIASQPKLKLFYDKYMHTLNNLKKYQ